MVRYWPEENILWFTWPNRPQDVTEGGWFEDQFNVLYDYLSKYPKFGMSTKVDWMAGVGERKTLGVELVPRRPCDVYVRSYQMRRR